MALQILPGRLLLGVLVALICLSPATRGSQAGPAAGDQCPASYNISKGTSVHPSSFQAGAELLGASLVASSLGCRSLCCSTRRCNLALLQEGSPGELTCHLLDCSSCPKSTCTLTSRPGFEASVSSVTVSKGVDPSEPAPVDCLSPSKTGDCRASFRRWYYDATTKTCKGFIYGGCLANGNNFKSEADCLKNCDGVAAPSNNSIPVSGRAMMTLKGCSKPCSADEFTCDDGCCVSLNSLCDGTTRCADKSDDHYCSAVRASFVLLAEYQQSTAPDDERCHAPKKVGSCRAAFPRWYFDPKALTCNLFIYGGCRGNKNNYESKDDCLTTCVGWKEVIPEPQKLQKDNSEDEAYCFAPAVTGKCRASFPRWYYDPKSQSCKAFTFGGCGANKNNYESEGECSARCSGKKGNLKPDDSENFDKQHDPEPQHHASAISMVVLLAICVLILLGGVIYFIVKLAKTDHVVSYHRTKSGEDKETLINTVENM